MQRCASTGSWQWFFIPGLLRSSKCPYKSYNYIYSIYTVYRNVQQSLSESITGKIMSRFSDLQNPSSPLETQKNLQSQLPQPGVFTAAPCVSKVSASGFLLALTTSKSGEPDVLLTSSLNVGWIRGPGGRERLQENACTIHPYI